MSLRPFSGNGSERGNTRKTLKKKRDAKVELELKHKSDKISQAKNEIKEVCCSRARRHEHNSIELIEN